MPKNTKSKLGSQILFMCAKIFENQTIMHFASVEQFIYDCKTVIIDDKYRLIVKDQCWFTTFLKYGSANNAKYPKSVSS